jgi:hypothetical protein
MEWQSQEAKNGKVTPDRSNISLSIGIENEKKSKKICGLHWGTPRSPDPPIRVYLLTLGRQLCNFF